MPRTADFKARQWQQVAERVKKIPPSMNEEFVIWLTGYVNEMCVSGDVRAKDVLRAWRSALSYVERKIQSSGPGAF